MPVWTLDDALLLVRAVQPETRKFAYHLCLGGGVLNNGKSDKDLDLYFLPLLNNETPNPEGLLFRLESLWGKYESIGNQQPSATRGTRGDAFTLAESPEYKDDPQFAKVKFMYSDSRIDVFIFKPQEEVK